MHAEFCCVTIGPHDYDALDSAIAQTIAPAGLRAMQPRAVGFNLRPNYQGTCLSFCTRKSENTLTFGARCLLLL